MVLDVPGTHTARGIRRTSHRSLQKCTTASSGCALFKVGQASMDGRGREMYRKSDGASADAFVTVLPRDRVQLALSPLESRLALVSYENT